MTNWPSDDFRLESNDDFVREGNRRCWEGVGNGVGGKGWVDGGVRRQTPSDKSVKGEREGGRGVVGECQ